MVTDEALTHSTISTVWGQMDSLPRHSGVVNRTRLLTLPTSWLLLMNSKKPVHSSRSTLRAENKLEKHSCRRPLETLERSFKGWKSRYSRDSEGCS